MSNQTVDERCQLEIIRDAILNGAKRKEVHNRIHHTPTYEECIKKEAILNIENEDWYMARLYIDLLDTHNTTADRAVEIAKILRDDLKDCFSDEEWNNNKWQYWQTSLADCSVDSWVSGDVLDAKYYSIV